MKCPYCGFEESKVIDSRSADDGERIRRRRECLKCGKRFTTHEIIETVRPMRMLFGCSKQSPGVTKAPVSWYIRVQKV